jgi:hypothetical protein
MIRSVKDKFKQDSRFSELYASDILITDDL